MLACTLSTGAGFGATIMSPPSDWGYPTGRAWVDFNGDGKTDYCRVVGGGGNEQIACTVSTGDGFGPTYVSAPLDWGYDLGRGWADFDGDGKADFCRRVGGADDELLQCTLSTGTGFGATVSSTVQDWGADTGWAWVDYDGDRTADYCRQIVFAGTQRVACTRSLGNSFGVGLVAP
jgi:hypothetical protein